jgi:peptide/nickel transport system ATP-binding protein
VGRQLIEPLTEHLHLETKKARELAKKVLNRGLTLRVRQELAAVQRRNNSALLLVTHDLGLARDISDRVAVMYAGEWVEVNTSRSFFKESRHPYSKALLASLPEKGSQPLPGIHPAMGALPCPAG